jgi:hypothetical protein
MIQFDIFSILIKWLRIPVKLKDLSSLKKTPEMSQYDTGSATFHRFTNLLTLGQIHAQTS